MFPEGSSVPQHAFTLAVQFVFVMESFVAHVAIDGFPWSLMF